MVSDLSVELFSGEVCDGCGSFVDMCFSVTLDPNKRVVSLFCNFCWPDDSLRGAFRSGSLFLTGNKDAETFNSRMWNYLQEELLDELWREFLHGSAYSVRVGIPKMLDGLPGPIRAARDLSVGVLYECFSSDGL